jgi:Tfp pilus assembly protein PilV
MEPSLAMTVAVERARRRARIGLPRRDRRGTSLIEVVIAITILSGAMLGLSAFMVKLTRASSAARLRTEAAQLVSDRMEAVKGAPRYAAIESLYVATESPIMGFPTPGFTRRTLVTHVGGQDADTIDYRVVTVEVTHARLTTPLRKTTVIAPF